MRVLERFKKVGSRKFRLQAGRNMGCLFFFFQAEDGIRDTSVTGVQTCALPICIRIGERRFEMPDAFEFPRVLRAIVKLVRSEERRVGKECRSRWSAYL